MTFDILALSNEPKRKPSIHQGRLLEQLAVLYLERALVGIADQALKAQPITSKRTVQHYFYSTRSTVMFKKIIWIVG